MENKVFDESHNYGVKWLIIGDVDSLLGMFIRILGNRYLILFCWEYSYWSSMNDI